jgi:hypothetical protein
LSDEADAATLPADRSEGESMTSTNAIRHGVRGEASALGPEAARRWWHFVFTGALWVLFSLIVFRLDLDYTDAHPGPPEPA